ncbi:MAG TPA: TonB family protein [Longimicrobiales bacterium]|nr:TonB family protein [Longimicrobiales bacterium]
MTANDRMKAGFGDWLWYSVAAAAALHLALFAFFPSMTAADYRGSSDELVAIDIPDQIEIPPPPEQIARPATPVVSDVSIDDDITIAPTTFDANPIENLPPPPTTSRGEDDLAAAPRWVPMEVRPELQNQRDLERLLARHYPPNLLAAGISGTPVLWFFIDENGRVLDTRLHTSSGYQALDEAARRVAPEMRFSPAMNRNQRVRVWVEIGINFVAR